MQAPARPSSKPNTATTESPLVKYTLISLSLVLLLFFLVLPLVVVFYEAFAEGWHAYAKSINDPETWQAIELTLITAVVAVPLNTLFGLTAAWCITKFDFRGKSILTTLIDLPFAVSPVVAGLTLVLLFGARGWFGPWLQAHDLKVIFALPGIILATVFITFPFVARELIPLMQAQGTDEEQAARVLGASAFQMFRRVTLPNIKWGLLYGLILCNARAMGEFGAVYVVSGNYSGQITLPLRVERVYYASVVSLVPTFAVASLLGVLAVITLVVKTFIEWKYKRDVETPMTKSQ
jgi:sulfate transport system permease protein